MGLQLRGELMCIAECVTVEIQGWGCGGNGMHA